MEKFREDCPLYESRAHIKKNYPETQLPENKKLHWCGDKGTWIYQCDDTCKRYNMLKSK